MSVDPKTNLQSSINKIRRIKEEQDLNSLNKVVPTKQDKLVDGVSIKRINGKTLLGGGNLTLEILGIEYTLTAGSNITIDRTDPNNPIISTTGLTSETDYSNNFLLGGM